VTAAASADLAAAASAVAESEPVRVIAIDGPAGSGKTTVAKALADALDLEFLNTGAMYRAVAFAVLRAGGDPGDRAFAAAVARRADIRVEGDAVTVDGVDASAEIRGPEVTRSVSAVAANPDVRSEMVAAQRGWAERRGGGVLEGRDIGTVVFPDAEFKAYLTVAPAEGARRRALQEGAIRSPDDTGVAEAVQAVAADLRWRNHLDSTREVDPLTAAVDAVTVDTTSRTSAETVDLILGLIESSRAAAGRDGP